ncbi:hypothetical protein [Roseovarius gaetbuli]|uniref:hypothetical protein n=1 Tax=Roseovarius gaetbuli TaxID=1356575 RepID=UPI001FE81253|nr:hypothetical protein [Roseovarius gaetbuli]
MCNCNDHDHGNNPRFTRRQALTGTAALGAATAATLAAGTAEAQTTDPYAPPAEPALPPSDMVLDLSRTALVVTDPQVDFLSPDGVTWGVVGESVTRNQRLKTSVACFARPRPRASPWRSRRITITPPITAGNSKARLKS